MLALAFFPGFHHSGSICPLNNTGLVNVSGEGDGICTSTLQCSKDKNIFKKIPQTNKKQTNCYWRIENPRSTDFKSLQVHLELWRLILLLIKYRKAVLYFLLLSVSSFNNTELCVRKMTFSFIFKPNHPCCN